MGMIMTVRRIGSRGRYRLVFACKGAVAVVVQGAEEGRQVVVRSIVRRHIMLFRVTIGKLLPIGIRFQVRVSTVGNANSSILAEMERKVSTRCSYALSQACEKCKKTKAAGNSRYRRQRNSNQWLQPCPSELKDNWISSQSR